MEITVIASGSTGNCYRISDGKTSLLLDAGIPLKAIQQGCDFSISHVAGCLVTHIHKDHSKAVKDLVRMGVDVYTSQGTIDAIGITSHRLHPVKSGKQFSIGTFTILPFDTEHDAPEPLGFLAVSVHTTEKLLYFTDTYYIKYKFTGLTHIMAECNYDADILFQNIKSGDIPAMLAPRIIKSHMSLEQLLDFLRANDLSKVQQIYLLHLSASNSNAAHFKEEVQRLTGTEVYVCD